MRKYSALDFSQRFTEKIAIRCISETSLITASHLPKLAIRGNSSLFPQIHHRTTTLNLRAFCRSFPDYKHSLLAYKQKFKHKNICCLYLHNSPLVELHKSSVLGPCSALLVFTAIIFVYSVAFNDIIAPKTNQKVNFLPTNKATESLYGENNSMTDEDLSGRPESLTSEQEVKLKELWAITLKVAGIFDDTSTSVDLEKKPQIDSSAPKKAKKKRISMFRRNKEEEDETESGIGMNETDDKFGQTKLFNDAMANMTPESLRASFWSMVKHDNPDALLLRFMRARQWDIEKALVMMISTMRWRLTEVHVDDDIVKNGELKALEQSNDPNSPKQKFGKDFLDQMRLGKSFLHGTDIKDRPIVLVRVRQHRQGEQSEESLERYTVYLIETARMVLAPPVDTASVIFDMTGFSMANMDYTPVKFMIKCFEANYPECLGVILVHKAPWIFQGIWKIIRAWLDPVVASKVQFTNNIEEVEEYVSRSQIVKELGGDEDWDYKYVEPVPGENDIMKDTDTRDKLTQEREKIVKDYEKATREWIQAKSIDSSAIYKKRQEIANSLKENYWKLDPYLRARTYYDRIGVISPGGIIQHYPQKNLLVESKNPNGIEK